MLGVPYCGLGVFISEEIPFMLGNKIGSISNSLEGAQSNFHIF